MINMETNNYLTRKDESILELKKVVDHLSNRISNLDELWIRNNPLEITIENQINDVLARYTIKYTDEFINSPIKYRIETNDGLVGLDLIRDELLQISPNLLDVDKLDERIVLRMTTNFVEEYSLVEKKVLANSLVNSMEESSSTKKKLKI